MSNQLVMVEARAYGIWDWPDTGIGDLACGINDATRQDGDCSQRAPYAILTLKDGEPNALGPLRGPYCRDHARPIIDSNRREIEAERERWRRADQRSRR